MGVHTMTACVSDPKGHPVAPVTVMVLLLGLGLAGGCTTSPAGGWESLREGMTYSEVQHRVGSMDSELNEALLEAREQQRIAERELAEVRSRAKLSSGAGGVLLPPMKSNVEVTSGGRRLVFREGRLVFWAPR